MEDNTKSRTNPENTPDKKSKVIELTRDMEIAPQRGGRIYDLTDALDKPAQTGTDSSDDTLHTPQPEQGQENFETIEQEIDAAFDMVQSLSSDSANDVRAEVESDSDDKLRDLTDMADVALSGTTEETGDDDTDFSTEIDSRDQAAPHDADTAEPADRLPFAAVPEHDATETGDDDAMADTIAPSAEEQDLIELTDIVESDTLQDEADDEIIDLVDIVSPGKTHRPEPHAAADAEEPIIELEDIVPSHEPQADSIDLEDKVQPAEPEEDIIELDDVVHPGEPEEDIIELDDVVQSDEPEEDMIELTDVVQPDGPEKDMIELDDVVQNDEPAMDNDVADQATEGDAGGQMPESEPILAAMASETGSDADHVIKLADVLNKSRFENDAENQMPSVGVDDSFENEPTADDPAGTMGMATDEAAASSHLPYTEKQLEAAVEHALRTRYAKTIEELISTEVEKAVAREIESIKRSIMDDDAPSE